MNNPRSIKVHSEVVIEERLEPSLRLYHFRRPKTKNLFGQLINVARTKNSSENCKNNIYH